MIRERFHANVMPTAIGPLGGNMPSKNERFVGIYELTIRAARVTDTTVPLSLQALLAIKSQADAARSNGFPIKQELSQDRLYVILDDVRIYRRPMLAAMLFTVADIDAADAVYRNIASGKERRFAKARDEGGAVSAHMVLKLTPEPNTLRYKVGLEDIEGASRSRILPFMEQMFRDYCGPVTAVTDEGPRQGLAVLELDSVHKDRITDAAGRPVAVELVRLRPRQTLDPNTEEGFTEMRRSVVFRIEPTPTVAESIQSVIRLRARQRTEFQNYPLMRIRWKRPDNRTQTLAVDGLAEDLLQRAFTRMELIAGIAPDLPASMVDIRDDVVNKIAAKL